MNLVIVSIIHCFRQNNDECTVSRIFLFEIMQNRCALRRVARLVLGPVHTDAFSKVCVLFENLPINSRSQYRFDAFSTIHTKRFENGRIARCNVIWNLCACPSMLGYNPRGTYDVIIFILMLFRPSTSIRYVCVCVLIHFQEHFQIHAFSMKTLSVLVWTESLNASKYMRFQMKTLYFGQGLIHFSV